MVVYTVGGTIRNNMTSSHSVFQVFKTLREARAYVKSNEMQDYYIEKCEMIKPTADNMITVINSYGGGWCMKNYNPVESRGSYVGV